MEVTTMAKITITYTAINAPSADTAAEICAMFYPNNAAADLPAFEGTYYDTNVEGWGEGTTLEKFIKDSVAHPGLVLALKLAVEEGSYEFETDDNDTIMYLEEVKDAVADQGFEIEVEKN
jgi:hypothetical protein